MKKFIHVVRRQRSSHSTFFNSVCGVSQQDFPSKRRFTHCQIVAFATPPIAPSPPPRAAKKRPFDQHGSCYNAWSGGSTASLPKAIKMAPSVMPPRPVKRINSHDMRIIPSAGTKDLELSCRLLSGNPMTPTHEFLWVVRTRTPKIEVYGMEFPDWNMS